MISASKQSQSRTKLSAPDRLVRISRALCEGVDALEFPAPVAYVYNPLRYARAPHEAYLRKFGHAPKKVLLVGMNPGPFGMAQTGVPFGDVQMVRDFLGIDGKVDAPPRTHPKRPVSGFDTQRSEVSGTRLWGWARHRSGTAEAFFRDFFVHNYCPLAFMEESSRNLTPDKLPKQVRAELFAVCDEALAATVATLSPEWLIGVGGFAEKRARAALDGVFNVGTILHPSPANPNANRGWQQVIEAQLKAYGLDHVGR